MNRGELLGLVATNALELGIDIGQLDATVLVGYPDTKASFWQQTGRAGRSGHSCTNYMILREMPFDQYIAVNPGWLFEGSSESAVIDPDNLLIQLAHIRAAAAEIPLGPQDRELFPDLGGHPGTFGGRGSDMPGRTLCMVRAELPGGGLQSAQH